ncbi:AAA family ATPase [Mesorhizobium sp. M1136]|uniref:AAA family ATPase n=1 Tax=Mesorhizobium sp. M1136 TaxID=2957059 RepID=UPI00333BA8EC
MIARALAMHPKLILFDEPTSALDPELVTGILETIRSLADKGMTLVIVTHEMGFARKLADVVHFIADGTIVESGPRIAYLSIPKARGSADLLSRYPLTLFSAPKNRF